MLTHHAKYIFIDLEATGPHPMNDRIIEIGLVEVTNHGVQHWSTLVNPQVPIPPFIQQLTGIDESMVGDAPIFAEVAAELRQRLHGALLIAHNARFDYGYLRHAYQRLNQAFRCEVLCTIKLSRKLFPEEVKHGLDALMARHGLEAPTRHRALADANLLWQFWRHLETTIPAPVLIDAIEQVLQGPSIPGHIAPELLDDIPDSPGVYLFYGEEDAPLYVGRASQLRARILSHVITDHLGKKDLRLAQQIRRIEWREMAGDVGSALLEAKLSKQLQPALSRAPIQLPELCSWQLCKAADTSWQPVLAFAHEVDFGSTDRLYGLFNSKEKAEMALRALADKHSLPLTIAGAVNTVDSEGTARAVPPTAKEYCQQLEAALAPLKLQPWPYCGAAGVLEKGADGRRDIHVIDNWAYLGTVHSEMELRNLLQQTPTHPRFELDTYKILMRALASNQAQLCSFASLGLTTGANS